MGLREGIYARIWSVKQNEKSCSGQLSVSKKNKETGEYDVQFSGYVTFAGEAAKKALDLGLPETMDRSNPIGRNVQIKSSPDISTWFNNKRYTDTMAVINRIKKAASSNVSEDEMNELIRCIGRGYNTSNITIWDFEVSEDSGANSGAKKNGKNSKSTKSGEKKSKPVSEKTYTILDEEDDDDLPF